MKKLKLYLETSVWNFYFADDSPDKRDITREFFRNIEKNQYEIFISRIVIEEIDRADINTSNKLMNLIDKFSPGRLVVDYEVQTLAEQYINELILPVKKLEDALHAAISSVYVMDILVSWNCRHLANYNKKKMINVINLREAYKTIDIITPMEVINYED